jgi:hypothetical protein
LRILSVRPSMLCASGREFATNAVPASERRSALQGMRTAPSYTSEITPVSAHSSTKNIRDTVCAFFSLYERTGWR